jgi:hypothetical protein
MLCNSTPCALVVRCIKLRYIKRQRASHLANSDVQRQIEPKGFAARAAVLPTIDWETTRGAQRYAVVLKLWERRAEQADHLNLPATVPRSGVGISDEYAEVQHVVALSHGR